MGRYSNVSFDGQPIEFLVRAPFIVLVDPLVLDGWREDFQSLPPDLADRIEFILSLPTSMHVGVQEIVGFKPGLYRLSHEDFEEVDCDNPDGSDEDGDLGGQESGDAVDQVDYAEHAADDRIFDIDTGSLIVVDLDHLGALARILPWERYDHALQAPKGDYSRFNEVSDELGGAFFGIVSADASTPFQGDGTYRLRRGAPHPVENAR
jgi:hypothetical protein